MAMGALIALFFCLDGGIPRTEVGEPALYFVDRLILKEISRVLIGHVIFYPDLPALLMSH